MRISDPKLRNVILAVIGDSEAQKILLALHDLPKSAETLSEETSVPLSSVYRKIAELRGGGSCVRQELRDHGGGQATGPVSEFGKGVAPDLLGVDD